MDVEEDSEFGAYAGAEIDLAANVKLNAEAQIYGGARGVDGGMQLKF